MAEKNGGQLIFQEHKLNEGKEPSNVCKMFNRIIRSGDSNIISQQRGEADLSMEEKISILKRLYEDDTKLFLTRFGKFLYEEDLDCFVGLSNEYEITYTLKKLRENLCGKTAKNRRYEALRRLEKDTDYFSEHEMRERSPLLYEQYIGQFMSDEEKLERDEKQIKDCEMKMSSFIFQQIDRDWLEKRQELELCREEEQMEEEEEEEEDDENDIQIEEKTKAEDTDQKFVKISDEEKLQYQKEFHHIMKQKFLEGLDVDFDYSKVDTNEEYDNLTIINQDAEDEYFDDEEPDTLIIDDNSQEIDSDDDYLSEKVLQKCCSTTR